MKNDYGGVVWTKHALQRLKERDISQGDAWYTWRKPDQNRRGKSGNWVYYKTYGDQKIEVVAKKDEKGKWIILSVWSRKIRVQKSGKAKDIFVLSFLKKFFSGKKNRKS